VAANGVVALLMAHYLPNKYPESVANLGVAAHFLYAFIGVVAITGLAIHTNITIADKGVLTFYKLLQAKALRPAGAAALKKQGRMDQQLQLDMENVIQDIDEQRLNTYLSDIGDQELLQQLAEEERTRQLDPKRNRAMKLIKLDRAKAEALYRQARRSK
jgi:hypothetical protein